MNIQSLNMDEIQWRKWNYEWIIFCGWNMNIHQWYFFNELISHENLMKFYHKSYYWMYEELWPKVHPFMNLNSWMTLHTCSFMEFTYNYMDKWNFECIFVDEIKPQVIFHGRKYFIFKQNEIPSNYFISSTMNFI